MSARLTRHWCSLLLAVALFASRTSAQQKLLTLDDIYDPATRVHFSGAPASGFVWVDASHYAWPRRTDGREGVEWTKVDAASGTSQPLFDEAALAAALAKLPGVSAEDASRAVHSEDLVFDRLYGAALAAIHDDLFVMSLTTGQAARLTNHEGEEEEATFSPDGSTVAFVRDNNLLTVDVATKHETPITTDGSVAVLNGKLDWVYEEEIYGRGHQRAYWWSPDSSRLAFLRIDDTPVSTYITLDDISYDPKIEKWRYPRAGDPNPTVKLGVAPRAGGTTDWIDTAKYEGSDYLIVRVGWEPETNRLVYEVQNRTQTWLDLDERDLDHHTTRTILHETSKAWISAEDTDLPTWLPDGSFVWTSTRSGWSHLYHYSREGTLIRPVTTGPWEVRTLHGVDRETGWVYFSGTEHSAIGSDVYRVKLNGTSLERLSKQSGTHEASFSPRFGYYLDTWSDVSTPQQVRLHRSDGARLRVVDENKVTALSDYRLSKPEFLQVNTRDGFVMEAMMIKPPDFDPSRRYPVYQFTYGGPHAQQVVDAWRPQNMYHQLLALHGIIVWLCDNRTASGKGVASTWTLQRRFGDVELRDIEDGLSWLKQQPYIDASRIGIHGWSYGGFMTVYALTHSTSFKMGIAGGTVSDWRDYDTVYTERYLGLPQDNADGYRASSPRFAAKDLHGALLLVHGAIDDNVHVQNTMQLAYELEKADKPFKLMLYPKSRHGIVDPALVAHLRRLMFDFTLEQLGADADDHARR